MTQIELLEPIASLRDLSEEREPSFMTKTKQIASMYFENGLLGVSEVVLRTLDNKLSGIL